MKILRIRTPDLRKDARLTEEGEPCVPNFGVCGKRFFLGLKSDGLSSIAAPGTIENSELDELFKGFCSRYPGIPEETLEKYVEASVMAATKCKDGLRVRVTHDGDNSGCKFTDPDGNEIHAARLE